MIGADLIRVTTDHLVLPTHEGGDSTQLAVYRHSASWCDGPGLAELMGEGYMGPDFGEPEHSLELLERLPLTVP